ESAHLVDVINQTDAIEDIDREDKLGQPMAQLTLPTDLGRFELLVLPGFRTRTFPGRHGRLRAAFVVDDDVDFEARLGRSHVDAAARWSVIAGDWQWALSHFYGTGRDPRFRTKLPATLPGDVEALLRRTKLTAVYDLIHQTGLELQYTGENLLGKLEAIGRGGQGDYRFAAVAGVEYTFYGVFGSGIDAGALCEALYDSFVPEDLPSAEAIPQEASVAVVADVLRGIEIDSPPSPFEHDLFAGLRLTFNDTQSTQILVGAIVDVIDGSRFWSIEASRRLGERWSIAADLRLFAGFADDSYFHGLREDDFVQLRLAYYL
ncbi:MAG TPA: hypothetical protein VEB21_19920, partial [Terriglobales bacterium]|nr:hypothetical protein [Terriglobales bacterium]